jgi:hypothetical protein
MKAIERQYRPLFRFHPIGIGVIARISHREHPMSISTKQQVKIDWQAASLGSPNINCAFRCFWL